MLLVHIVFSGSETYCVAERYISTCPYFQLTRTENNTSYFEKLSSNNNEMTYV